MSLPCMHESRKDTKDLLLLSLSIIIFGVFFLLLGVQTLSGKYFANKTTSENAVMVFTFSF